MLSKIKKILLTAPSYRHWQKIGIRHHHGFCLPLFALRSKDSCGIGEFLDLLLLLGWSQKIGMDVLQLLPLNETSYEDFSPYNAISSCALDPIYLSLSKLPFLENDVSLKRQIKDLQKYNKTKRVQYKIIRRKKQKWLRQYYDLYFEAHYKNLKELAAFKKNNPWLKAYSLFCCLKKQFQNKKWKTWPQQYRNPQKKWLASFEKEHQKELEFYQFVQYLCCLQLSEVKRQATKKQMLIIGDVPILVGTDSSDVWYYREIFKKEKEAGAPPDKFCAQGQKWKFPLLDWEALERKGYFWWKQKLGFLNSFCHVYRIDHSVGLFRIWAINRHEKAVKGKFLPYDVQSWKILGEKHLLALLKSSTLLPIAEDLGFIPEMVFKTLKKLGLCGTKVLRWQLANPLSDYEPLNVVTVSTHDIETLGRWWQKNPEEARVIAATNQWIYKPKLTFQLRKKILHDVHHAPSLFHVNLLQEYLALFPQLTRKGPNAERINKPATIGNKNWTYKFKPSLEKIVSHKGLKKTLREILH